MPAHDMPAAEIDVDATWVRALLVEQFPDLAELKVVWHASGWDNVVFRLGEAFAVRLPRRSLGAELTRHEQRWLPAFADYLPLPISAPVRLGRPGADYPWPWSVCRWLPGVVAAEARPDDLFEAATTLGHFLVALHREAPTDAPANALRGVPLHDRTEALREGIRRLHGDVDGRAVLMLWGRAVETPSWPGRPVWIHGDLHPANLLVHQGRLSGVIDFGDMTGGDPATDMAVAWMLFPTEVRPAFREALGGVDDDTWARARGWALALAVACLANSADNPLIRRIGAETLDAVLAERI